MAADKTNQTITLRDGRKLGYTEYGAPQGKTVFEFHGNPSSRLGSKFLDEAAKRLDARIIGIDRPGMGLADHKPGRKLLDWPDDVTELADALGIDRFAILGGSGGAPSVLACAYKIPERLTAVAVLFPPRPLDTPGAADSWSRSERLRAFLGRRGPLWAGRLFLSMVARGMRSNPDAIILKDVSGIA